MRCSRDTAVPPRRPDGGFTLIELMIALVIAGVLVSIALPMFNDAIRKSRRSEALVALSAVQQAQERWRANNSSYASNTQLTLPVVPASAGDPVGLGFSATTAGGYYALAISQDNAARYVVTASATTGKSQAQDAGCQVMAVKMENGAVQYASGTSGVDWTAANKDPKGCWAK